jgi:hypothetical protein
MNLHEQYETLLEGKQASERRHNIKVWPLYFVALLSGDKTFEWRRNDRNYAVGDVLLLQEFEPPCRTLSLGSYTGRVAHAVITYKAEGVFGIPEGYCILGFKRVQLVENEPAKETA